MGQRINFFEKGQSAMKTLFGIGGYLNKSTLGNPLLDLVYFRVSQINGCAYCLDMHSKDLIANGEEMQRLFVMEAWRETAFFSARERAALAWAEELTSIPNNDVCEKVYNEACMEFTEQELIDLTMAVTTINTYNRINLAFRPLVGTYKVGMLS